MLRRFLCSIGLHRPMERIDFLFWDFVARKEVNHYRCACGIDWMAHSAWGWRMKRPDKGEDTFG